MKNKSLQNNKRGLAHRSTTEGFTIIETLVAISIFTVSILGLMSVLASGIANTTYAKNKIIAGYLAQEGIEYVRNMRDTSVLYDATDALTGWNSFSAKLTAASCQLANGCYFGDLTAANFTDPAQPMKGIPMTACSSGTCTTLLYDKSTGKYNYISGVNSGFIRKITIIPTSNDIEVFSTVYWKQGLSQYNVTFSEDLLSWVE